MCFHREMLRIWQNSGLGGCEAENAEKISGVISRNSGVISRNSGVICRTPGLGTFACFRKRVVEP